MRVVHLKLLGIVSYGQDCADEKYPGVYTNASKFSEWISYSFNFEENVVAKMAEFRAEVRTSLGFFNKEGLTQEEIEEISLLASNNVFWELIGFIYEYSLSTSPFVKENYPKLSYKLVLDFEKEFRTALEPYGAISQRKKKKARKRAIKLLNKITKKKKNKKKGKKKKAKKSRA